MKDARLREISDATRSFLSVVEEIASGNDIDVPLLFDAYIDSRLRLTAYFAGIAAAALPNAVRDLEKTVSEVQGRAREALDTTANIKFPSYGRSHALVLAYLRCKPDHFASVSELRLLLGEQVHTERRLRELRDLGFTLTAMKISGRDGYKLATVSPDVSIGIRRQMELAKKENRRSPIQRL